MPSNGNILLYESHKVRKTTDAFYASTNEHFNIYIQFTNYGEEPYINYKAGIKIESVYRVGESNTRFSAWVDDVQLISFMNILKFAPSAKNGQKTVFEINRWDETARKMHKYNLQVLVTENKISFYHGNDNLVFHLLKNECKIILSKLESYIANTPTLISNFASIDSMQKLVKTISKNFIDMNTSILSQASEIETMNKNIIDMTNTVRDIKDSVDNFSIDIPYPQQNNDPFTPRITYGINAETEENNVFLNEQRSEEETEIETEISVGIDEPTYIEEQEPPITQTLTDTQELPLINQAFAGTINKSSMFVDDDVEINIIPNAKPTIQNQQVETTNEDVEEYVQDETQEPEQHIEKETTKEEIQTESETKEEETKMETDEEFYERLKAYAFEHYEEDPTGFTEYVIQENRNRLMKLGTHDIATDREVNDALLDRLVNEVEEVLFSVKTINKPDSDKYEDIDVNVKITPEDINKAIHESRIEFTAKRKNEFSQKFNKDDMINTGFFATAQDLLNVLIPISVQDEPQFNFIKNVVYPYFRNDYEPSVDPESKYDNITFDDFCIDVFGMNQFDLREALKKADSEYHEKFYPLMHSMVQLDDDDFYKKYLMDSNGGTYDNTKRYMVQNTKMYLNGEHEEIPSNSKAPVSTFAWFPIDEFYTANIFTAKYLDTSNTAYRKMLRTGNFVGGVHKMSYNRLPAIITKILNTLAYVISLNSIYAIAEHDVIEITDEERNKYRRMLNVLYDRDAERMLATDEHFYFPIITHMVHTVSSLVYATTPLLHEVVDKPTKNRAIDFTKKSIKYYMDENATQFRKLVSAGFFSCPLKKHRDTFKYHLLKTTNWDTTKSTYKRLGDEGVEMLESLMHESFNVMYYWYFHRYDLINFKQENSVLKTVVHKALEIHDPELYNNEKFMTHIDSIIGELKYKNNFETLYKFFKNKKIKGATLESMMPDYVIRAFEYWNVVKFKGPKDMYDFLFDDKLKKLIRFGENLNGRGYYPIINKENYEYFDFNDYTPSELSRMLYSKSRLIPEEIIGDEKYFDEKLRYNKENNKVYLAKYKEINLKFDNFELIFDEREKEINPDIPENAEVVDKNVLKDYVDLFFYMTIPTEAWMFMLAGADLKLYEGQGKFKNLSDRRYTNRDYEYYHKFILISFAEYDEIYKTRTDIYGYYKTINSEFKHINRDYLLYGDLEPIKPGMYVPGEKRPVSIDDNPYRYPVAAYYSKELSMYL